MRRVVVFPGVIDSVRVRPSDGSDREAWGELYRSYAASGGVAASDEQVDRVWSWIRSSSHATSCYIATVEQAGQVGFVHWRPFEIPIHGAEGLYVDDLFVAPEHRGSGVAARLVEAVRREAGRRGGRCVRWTTRPGNLAAQALYDRIATRSEAITFNADPI